MIKKFIKIVTGLLVGLVLTLGVTNTAKAEVIYVFTPDGQIHMMDSSADDIPNGIMAYDVMPKWDELAFDFNFNDFFAAMNGFSFDIDWSQMANFGALDFSSNSGNNMFGFNEDGQLVFLQSLYPWIAPENTFGYISDVHTAMLNGTFANNYVGNSNYATWLYLVNSSYNK